ncbi:MAG: hypothetical protein IIC26_04270 [Chloroflexi bacterium]|nr:hypothetical protein [Chloroflexota bacterium]
MWSKFMDVKSGYTAQIWLEFFQAEGVALRIVPPLETDTPMNEARELWVPDSKTHVAAELLRKI